MYRQRFGDSDKSTKYQALCACGIATSGAVLSTLREAADKDERLTILSDCCADSDEEVQRVLMTTLFSRQADGVTAEAWSSRLAQASHTKALASARLLRAQLRRQELKVCSG